MPSNPPRVFVTGCPRSGTSLMKVLLYSLKGLHGAMRGQQKITTAHVGQWKRDPARVAEVIADPDLRNRMCKWLIRLGYERDGQWLRSCL